MSETMMTGWDCHAHVFGPYARFPLAAERSYTPPEAVEEHYLEMLATLGLSHGVLVHPSAYGEDHGLLYYMLEKYPQLRGVVVMPAAHADRLKGLRQRGVRAARFSQRAGAGSNFAGSASFEDLLALAPRLADEGLHAELWTDCATLPALAAQIAALPVPVVIDHMGGFDYRAGVDEPGFRALRKLLESGKAWVKLCVYRNLFTAPSPEAGRAFHEALVRANPAQVVWGSDWPHLRVEPEPDTAGLLRLMKEWTPEEAVVKKILVENPARLYG